MEKECLKIIIEQNLLFSDEIFIYANILPSEFRETGLDKSVMLNDALDVNRAKLKKDLRLKWFESTNATLNAALYKLVCTQDERLSFSSSSSLKNSLSNEICTQEEYLKSLKEMSEVAENAD